MRGLKHGWWLSIALCTAAACTSQTPVPATTTSTTTPATIEIGTLPGTIPGEDVPTPPSDLIPHDESFSTACRMEESDYRCYMVEQAIQKHFPAHLWLWAAETFYCESEFNPEALGPYGEMSIAQIHPHWQRDADRLGLDPWNVDDNIALARYVYDIQGPQAWTCSPPIDAP